MFYVLSLCVSFFRVCVVFSVSSVVKKKKESAAAEKDGEFLSVCVCVCVCVCVYLSKHTRVPEPDHCGLSSSSRRRKIYLMTRRMRRMLFWALHQCGVAAYLGCVCVCVCVCVYVCVCVCVQLWFQGRMQF